MTKVRIRQGEVQGTNDNGVHSFKGIPFAAPVQGLNRWRPPQPPETWEQVRDATRYGSVCHQPIIKAPAWLMGRAAGTYMSFANTDETPGDDCLNLNVWTPLVDRAAKLPVMVWIHGGGSIQGSGSKAGYNGHALAGHDVVVVTINYRLGLAGFLSSPESFDGDVMAPNRGFLDQIAALEWVQENIESFGGDPGQVTIFGESAGGMSVSVLLGSPLTKGLFERAIVMSGVPEAGASISHHQALADDFFEKVKIQKGDCAALEAMTGDEVVNLFDQADKLARTSVEKYGGLARGFGGASNAYNTEFMPVPILDAISAGQIKDVDLMLGTMKDDARLFSIMMPGPTRLGSALSMKVFRNWKGGEREVKAWRDAYLSFLPGASAHLVREQIVTDWVFRRGTVRAAEAHAASRNANTFLYQFEWESPALNGVLGSIHGIEIPMVFRNLQDSKGIIGDIDVVREFSERVSDLWLNFAKTGVPKADDIPAWEPFDSDSRTSMTLNTTFEIRRDTDKEKSDFWGARREGRPF